jgi:hypothetical protein
MTTASSIIETNEQSALSHGTAVFGMIEFE